MIDLRLNKKRLEMHWHYYRVRYLVFLAAALFAANLLYTTTKPQTPATQKVDILIVTASSAASDTTTWQSRILSALPPDQKEVNITSTALIQGQENTIYQLIAARMAAHEGSMWILPSDVFKSYAASGAFLPLDDVIGAFQVPKGADLSATKVNNTSTEGKSETHVYGIPLDKCKGISTLFDPTGMVLAIPIYNTASVNYANTVTAANWLLAKTDDPTLIDSSITEVNIAELTVAALGFHSQSTVDWQTKLKAVLPSSQAALVTELPYVTGREAFVADYIASGVKTAKTNGIAIVTHDVFVSLARTGALQPLDDYLSALKVPAGTDLGAGKESALDKNKALGAAQQFGIPLDNCTGLSDLVNPKGMMLVLPKGMGTPNGDLVKAVMNWLLTKQ